METDKQTNLTELATFAAGCFWGVEELYRELPGVKHTAVGYTGGKAVSPSYEEVSGGATGHAEAVQITYDPAQVTYDKLLQIFWENHDPTTANRQGPDVGEQYRSVIFYHTPAQQAAAEASKQSLAVAKKFTKPIVTAIVPAGEFYRAEDYHQQYLFKRGVKVCH